METRVTRFSPRRSFPGKRLAVAVVALALAFACFTATSPKGASASTTCTKPSGSVMTANSCLYPGDSLHSAGRRFALWMQSTDGNLVLYDGTSGSALWAMGAQGVRAIPGSHAAMQSDGNFVVYSPSDAPLWALSWQRVTPIPGSYAVMQDDGNFVIYDPFNHALWSTGTGLPTAWHHYRIELKAWIPQPYVVDPWDPALNRFTILGTADFPCVGLFTTSRFAGDGYTNFDGGSSARGDRVVDFDWDGSQIHNFTTSVVLGVTHRVIAYSNIFGSGGCVVQKTASDSGFAYQGSASSLNLAIQTSNPLVPGAPAIHATMNVGILSNGTLNINYQTTYFPSIGFKVTRDGQNSMTDIANDASCLSNDAVLGPSGLALLPVGLLNFNDTGSVVVIPGATNQVSQGDWLYHNQMHVC